MFKLPSFIFAAVMGLWMSMTVTVALTLYRVGWHPQLFSLWLEAWIITYPLAILCIVIYRPAAIRLTNYLIDKLKQSHSF